MSQAKRNSLSEQDARLLQTSHLGHLLKVYRASRRSVIVQRIAGLSVACMAFVGAIIVIIFIESPFGSSSPVPFFLLSSVLFGLAIATGVTAIPNTQKVRLLVCEKGMLQVTRSFCSIV